MEGCVHTIDPEKSGHEAWTKVKHVPPERIIARLQGCWRNELRYKREEDSVRSPPLLALH